MQKIHLDLTGDSGGACTEIRMGETIRVDVQCRDSLNTPATPTSDLEVNLQVVVSSFRGTQDTVELGMRTLRIADLAEESRWEGLPIFFLPKDQPSAAHPMKYALKVTHDGGEGRSLLGRSSEWTFLEEKKVEGKPEIEAAEVHKFHEDSQARSRPERTDRIATGGEAQIWNLLQSSDVVRELRPEWWEKVAKEAKEAGTTPGQAQTHTIREFLKDMCIWKRVSDKCGGKVAEFKGWYLSLPPDGASDPPYAGLRLKGVRRRTRHP